MFFLNYYLLSTIQTKINSYKTFVVSVLRMEQNAGLLGLLIALVLLGLDLKLTYSQKPMPPSVSVTQRL